MAKTKKKTKRPRSMKSKIAAALDMARTAEPRTLEAFERPERDEPITVAGVPMPGAPHGYRFGF